MSELAAQSSQVHGLKYNGAAGSLPGIQGPAPTIAIIFMVAYYGWLPKFSRQKLRSIKIDNMLEKVRKKDKVTVIVLIFPI